MQQRTSVTHCQRSAISVFTLMHCRRLVNPSAAFSVGTNEDAPILPHSTFPHVLHIATRPFYHSPRRERRCAPLLTAALSPTRRVCLPRRGSRRRACSLPWSHGLAICSQSSVLRRLNRVLCALGITGCKMSSRLK